MSTGVSFHPTEETILDQDLQRDVDENSGRLNSIFSMKVHQSKTILSDPTGHDVTFNVTFAMAVPGVFTNARVNDSFSTRNSSVDPLRSNNQYFHVEFDLFSKEIHKESYKTDIGFYGTFAKIYPDRAESKVVPTWSDSEDTWICWIQRFVVRVTDRHVQSLCNHNMKISVWDTKDKCAPKVRFDHPKAPKSASRSKSTNEMTGWTKQMVMMLSHDFEKTASFFENSEKILPHKITSSHPIKKEPETKAKQLRSAKSTTTTKSSAQSPDSAIKEKEFLYIGTEPKEGVDANLGSYAQLENLLDPKASYRIKTSTRSGNNTTKPVEKPPVKAIDQCFTARSESRKSTVIPGDFERYNRLGRLTLDIRISDLFLRDQTLNRIATSTNTLEDMFCLVNIESDLLSVEQKKTLKPLIINIKKIDQMPKQSETFVDINKKYSPLYCQYRFTDLEPYQTVGRIHNTNIRLDDISVVLLGTLDPMKLKSQMMNSFLTIKLFDRIENPKVGTENDSTNESDDVNMGDINITSSKPTITSVTVNKPRGEAKIDLSDIVNKGLKYLEVMVPIVPTSSKLIKPDMRSTKNLKEDNCASFLEAGTTIKVSFKLTEPLIFVTEQYKDKLYNKIVVVNKKISCDFVRKEISEAILRHNCRVLNFTSGVVTEMQTFLYSVTKHHSKNQNLFSGFYIVDRKCEILVIESTQENVRTLFEQCSSQLDKYQDKFSDYLKFIYDESLQSEEKEDFQPLTMVPLLLSKDISFFVSQPLLYVRDMLPRECVEGICKVNELLSTDSMNIVLRNEFIPTSHMIESISQYLCSHLNPSITKSDQHDFADLSKNSTAKKIDRNGIRTAVYSERVKVNKSMKRSQTNMSGEYVHPKEGFEFSYSCQSNNSICSAKQIIRNKLDPNKRYTYSQSYLLSGSFDPVDLNEEYAREEKMLRAEPRWTNKKEATSVNSLPSSRREDLDTKWVENSLHRSFMQPTLPERDLTNDKFDLYIRPLNILNRDPISIMPSYTERLVSDKAIKEFDNEKWRRKVCVSDLMFKSHRVLPKTEMTERGRLSSNQLSKLQGLRKDASTVSKKSHIKEIPAIYVIPSTQDVNGAFTVGPETDRNLLVNYVPVVEHDQEFKNVYQPSKERFIYKNFRCYVHNQYASPFFVYG